MNVKFVVRSEIGHVRKNNEDNFFCNGIFMTPSEQDKPFFLKGVAEVPCIFAVLDGMGGHDCGELASLTVAEILAEHSRKIIAGSHDDVDDFVRDANTRLLRIMRERNITTGTTLTMSVLRQNFFSVYNIGDSRAYSMKNDYLTRISEDHNMAAEMVREGRLDPRKAESSRYSNILTRFIGIRDEFEARHDVYAPLNYDENKRVILCSDGLNKMLTHREINDIVKNSEDAIDAVNRLTETALIRGGHDNITCIVIDIGEGVSAN